MSKKILYYCDKCKVQTDEKNLNCVTVQYDNIAIKRELCPLCLAKLNDFLPKMEEVE